MKNLAVAVATTFSCVAGGMYIYRYIQKYKIKQRIKERREECKMSCERMAEHLNLNGLSLEKRNSILKLPIKELQSKLQSGELKALEVLQAYQSKALEIDKYLNCIVEPIWEAEEMALERDLDTKKKGILHGIPVSIKECFCLKGYDCTGGMCIYMDQPVEDDSPFIKVLKKQGAVPFVRTNIPQTMMTFDCSNPQYGQTVNPHDHKRGPGGSSGGEGAVIGGGGSILGFGTDIGGSIRIPSNMCGVYGLKPTYGRLSVKNNHPFQRGQPIVKATTGPMAQDVDGLVLAMTALLDPFMFELDPDIPPVPFRREIYEDNRPLKIGYYVDDGYLLSVPSHQRAVHEVKSLLESKGHTLVPFQPPDAKLMFSLFLKACFGDGGQTYIKTLRDDILDDIIKIPVVRFKMPNIITKCLSWLISTIARDPFMYTLANSMSGSRSVFEYWKLNENIQDFRESFLKQWKANKLDAVICPGFAYPAFESGKASMVLGGVTYTVMYNLLNYPAGSLPVTTVTSEDTEKLKDYPSKRVYEKFIKQFCLGSEGLPVNIQCVALPFQEELVLRLMKEIEQGAKLS